MQFCCSLNAFYIFIYFLRQLIFLAEYDSIIKFLKNSKNKKLFGFEEKNIYILVCVSNSFILIYNMSIFQQFQENL